MKLISAVRFTLLCALCFDISWHVDLEMTKKKNVSPLKCFHIEYLCELFNNSQHILLLLLFYLL